MLNASVLRVAVPSREHVAYILLKAYIGYIFKLFVSFQFSVNKKLICGDRLSFIINSNVHL